MQAFLIQKIQYQYQYQYQLSQLVNSLNTLLENLINICVHLSEVAIDID